MTKIKDFSFETDELSITWQDLSHSRLAAIWLRDHCQMATSRDSASGQRLLNITDIPDDVSISKAMLEGDQLIIQFGPDGHRSEFASDWLYNNCYCRNQQRDDRSEAGKILWQGSSFDENLPRYRYSDFADQGGSKLSALKSVRDYGFVLLDNVPCQSGQVLKVIEEIGFVRKTNYGDLFDVFAKIDANNLAFTNLGLGCHLDNPYRDPVPGLQLLHCLESSTAGGETILQDGFMAASKLRDESADHFSLLSRNWVNFRFCDQHTDLLSRVPFIELNDLEQIIKVRFNNRSIDTLKLPAEKIKSFYKAYRHYAEILERPDLQINFKLQPGELVLFDNTRVLHARKAYSAGGSRHLQGAYSDLDGLYSCLNKLESA
jgi:gamma-butyrobetaine hydroxylase